MKTLWICLVLAACGGKKPEAPAAGSADPEIEAFVADFIAYGDKSVVMLAKFDGNCDAVADQMLTLEPLAQKLRVSGVTLDEAKLRARLNAARADAMKHYEDMLKPMGLTMADLDKKEADMKAKCKGNPKYDDAVERTGLMKKKH